MMENKNSACGVDVSTRFFKDTRERCMGTFVDSPQYGGGRDDIGSVSQRKTILPCRFVTNADPELFF